MKFLRLIRDSLRRLFHIHDWECVGRYRPQPASDPCRMTFQMHCRGCGKWKTETD